MRLASLILLGCSLPACSSKFELPPPPDFSDVVAAQKDASRYVGEGSKVLAVCGGSRGGGFYLDNLDAGFEPDAITDGQIIFVEDAAGNPNVLTRDILPELIVATEDGGIINRFEGREPSGLGVWSITYPATGVTVTHNLTGFVDEKIVDLWVQNKPPVQALPARSQTFLSTCVQAL